MKYLETEKESYINSFHILSNNDREVERFIDSQVKYGKVYEYKINRVVAIVGNKYAYLDPGVRRTENDKKKEDQTKQEPKIQTLDRSLEL